MKKSIFICLLVLSSLISFTTSAASFNFDAQSYVLINSKTKQVLYSYHPNLKWRPASLTKIMTALIALEKAKLSDKMTVSQTAINDIPEDYRNLQLKPGTKYTLDYLLNTMLIISANLPANVIAENISPSMKDFVTLMNSRAKAIGAKNTHFVNTFGRTYSKADDLHLSTAYDLALIACQAMKLPSFRSIVKTKYYKIGPTYDISRWHTCININHLIQEDPNISYKKGKVLKYFHITGMKTGFTSKSKNNVIASAVDKDGTELIAVVLGVPSHFKSFDYAKKLLEYGYQNFGIQ